MKIKSTYFKREFDIQKAELIGKGTFAQVYRIYNQDINDSLAIRKVKKNEGDLADIEKEKLINQELRRVESQNILKIYDIIDQPQIVWYITEYCSGGSLWDALNLCKDNKMNQKDCLECVLQISKGVQQLHNHRITHRDLKPQNILLKTKYVPGKVLPVIKLADFGLSTQKIIMQTIAGTKQYIAPEQAKFHNYTNAVDVWSLGIILDEILHGTPFYSGQDNKQVFNKILKTPFKVRNQNLRPSIKDLLICLLKKKPYQRPIIVVIRGTIQRILQQITAQKANNAQLQSEPTKNRKSSIQHLPISHQNNKANKQDKNRIISMPIKESVEIIQNTRKYQLNNIVYEPKKIEKPLLSKDISPRNLRRPLQAQKQQSSTKNLLASNFKRQIKQVKQVKQLKQVKQVKQAKQILQVKQIQKQVLQSEVKSINNDKQLKISKVLKIQQKQQSKHQINSLRQQPGFKTPSNAQIHQNQKITLIKNQKRKLIASHIKKQQLKVDILNINKYMLNISNDYKRIAQIQIKIQKEHDFLPNAYLNSNNFNELVSGNQNLKQFKKDFDFINYLSFSDDYQIRLYRGEKYMKSSRQTCQSQLIGLRQRIRDGFFGQLDLFIDQYIEKVLK